MSMIGKECRYRGWKHIPIRTVKALLNFAYVLPRTGFMPTMKVIMYANGEKQIFEDVKDIRTSRV